MYIVLAEKKQFFIDILKEHNQHRRMHKSLLLYLSEEVSNNTSLLLFVE